jgi:hypothetical protein
MDFHCIIFEPQLACLAYLLVVVAHTVKPHECILTLQMYCSSNLNIHQSVPMVFLLSKVSTPKKNQNRAICQQTGYSNLPVGLLVM